MDTKAKRDLLMKLMLVLVRDRQAMQGRIRSVGYLREYGRLPEDLGAQTLGRMSEEEITALAERVGIKKAPAGAKSDIYLNDMGYVLHSFAAYPPVIMDRVTRDGWQEVCQRIQVSPELFDAWVSEQPEGERKLTDAIRSYEDRQEDLRKILVYYLFTGTERGTSLFPADFICNYEDPVNTNTWAIYDQEQAMALLWDKLWVSAGQRETDGAQVLRIWVGDGN